MGKCSDCLRYPQQRDMRGCCGPKQKDARGRSLPHVGAGLELFECPISYGFYADRSFTPSLSAELIAEWRDREAGIVPRWGEGSILYHTAMHLIQSFVTERRDEITKEKG